MGALKAPAARSEQTRTDCILRELLCDGCEAVMKRKATRYARSARFTYKPTNKSCHTLLVYIIAQKDTIPRSPRCTCHVLGERGGRNSKHARPDGSNSEITRCL